ncbi:hypothetical protein [Botrimarina hoheduenensis]|uniref:Tetratricopeptide repeat protein n=1 Tax=Botrimarina hoheduenensis TaxID=2528000 RepID=A0A5C5WD41_9BACT|nr:hypothetical protein [Botrimarina hoheduenensis]TWT47582.1 hypothetical protein Pla111_11970 [Botrimarina hoheduenensis]
MTGGEIQEALRARRFTDIRIRLLAEGNTDRCGEEKRLELYRRALARVELRLGNARAAAALLTSLVESNPLPGAGDYNERGACYWLMEDREAAIRDWREGLRCKYGDGAGNLSPALLLYYPAVALSDEALRQEAIEAIEQRLNTGWAKNWPAPLGRYLLDQADDAELAQEIAREHPISQPDERCRFEFYRAIKAFERGDEPLAIRRCQCAVAIEQQTTSSTEFVLADHMVRQAAA